jgi:hypothetical protein
VGGAAVEGAQLKSAHQAVWMRCCGVLLLAALLIPHGATFTPRQSQAMRDEVSERPRGKAHPPLATRMMHATSAGWPSDVIGFTGGGDV